MLIVVCSLCVCCVVRCSCVLSVVRRCFLIVVVDCCVSFGCQLSLRVVRCWWLFTLSVVVERWFCDVVCL